MLILHCLGKSVAEKLENFDRRTTFRLKPVAFVSGKEYFTWRVRNHSIPFADEQIPSIEYIVKYFITKRYIHLWII